MTADERRLMRIRHDGKLLGWQVSVQGDHIHGHNERGAAIRWPWPRTDAHERTLLELLRLPVPRSPEDEAARLERLRRKAEVESFYQARMGGLR